MINIRARVFFSTCFQAEHTSTAAMPYPLRKKLREGIITNIQTHIKLLTLLTHRNVVLSRYFRSGWLITLTQKFRLITRIQSWLWHWFNEIIICNSINGLERHMHFLFVILQKCAIYDKYFYFWTNFVIMYAPLLYNGVILSKFLHKNLTN